MAVLVKPRRTVPPGTVDTARRHSTISRLVEGPEPVPFGRAVVQGSGDRTVKLADGASPFVGIAVPGEQGLAPDGSAPPAGAYAPKAWAVVLASGAVWIEAAGAVLPGAPVYFNATNGNLGTVPGDGFVQLLRAAFQNSALVGDVCLFSF